MSKYIKEIGHLSHNGEGHSVVNCINRWAMIWPPEREPMLYLAKVSDSTVIHTTPNSRRSPKLWLERPASA